MRLIHENGIIEILLQKSKHIMQTTMCMCIYIYDNIMDGLIRRAQGYVLLVD